MLMAHAINGYDSYNVCYTVMKEMLVTVLTVWIPILIHSYNKK